MTSPCVLVFWHSGLSHNIGNTWKSDLKFNLVCSDFFFTFVRSQYFFAGRVHICNIYRIYISERNVCDVWQQVKLRICRENIRMYWLILNHSTPARLFVVCRLIYLTEAQWHICASMNLVITGTRHWRVIDSTCVWLTQNSMRFSYLFFKTRLHWFS